MLNKVRLAPSNESLDYPSNVHTSLFITSITLAHVEEMVMRLSNATFIRQENSYYDDK